MGHLGRGVIAISIASMIVLSTPTGLSAAVAPQMAMRILIAPESEVIQLPGDPKAIGMGAQLPDPSVDLFLETFWNGGDVTVGLESRTGAAGFGDLLREAGYTVVACCEKDGLPPTFESFSASTPAGASLVEGGKVVSVIATDEPYARASDDIYTVVLGIGPTLPVMVVLPAEVPSLLDPERAGLPGLLSPYDLTRSLAARLGIAVQDGAPGAVIAALPDPDTEALVISRTNRFRSDLKWRRPVTGTSVGIIIGSCLLGIAFSLRRRKLGPMDPNIYSGIVLGSFAGSLVATLLPLGTWPNRVGVVVAWSIGGGMLSRTPRGARAIASALSSLILTVLPLLTVLAALISDGEPALSLWPSPLEASRASGLLNGYGVLMIGALVTLRALNQISKNLFLVSGLLVTAVIALPWLGANYGGGMLAIVAIGGYLAIERSGRLRVRDIGLIGAASIVVLIAALAADLGGQTHGGRFLTALREDGIGLLGDTLRGRLDTSGVVIARFGWIAWLGFFLMLPVLALIGVGLFAPAKVPILARRTVAVRAAVGGLLLAAFAALVVEDTGFLTAGSLLGFIIANLIRREEVV